MCPKDCIRFQLTLSGRDHGRQPYKFSFCSRFLYNFCGISVAEWYAPTSYITLGMCVKLLMRSVFLITLVCSVPVMLPRNSLRLRFWHLSLISNYRVRSLLETITTLSIKKYQRKLTTSRGSVLLRTSCSSFVTTRVTFSIFKSLPAKSSNS